MQIFQCVPVSYSWEGWMGAGVFGDASNDHCINVNTLTYTAAAFSIAQDIVILVLPVPLLLKLHTSKRRKAGILIMFSLGIFVLITSCVRLRFIVRFARSTNPTWDYTDSLIWSGLEVAVSIIVTSLPAIRVLLNRVLPKVWLFAASSARRSTDGRGGMSASAGIEGTPVDGPKRPARSLSGGGRAPRPVRSAQSRLFSLMAGSRSSLNESEIELGDMSKGEIASARTPRGEASTSYGGGTSRIQVQTTTTIEGTPRARG